MLSQVEVVMDPKKSYKKSTDFDHFLKGLTDSYERARSLAENQHIESLKKFIDDDDKPKFITIKMPDNNGEYQDVKVPTMTLAPIFSTRLKEMEIEFRVKITGCGKKKSRTGEGIFKNKDKGAVCIDMSNSVFKSGQYAKCKVKYDTVDAPEGVVRINNNLIKLIP